MHLLTKFIITSALRDDILTVQRPKNILSNRNTSWHSRTLSTPGHRWQSNKTRKRLKRDTRRQRKLEFICQHHLPNKYSDMQARFNWTVSYVDGTSYRQNTINPHVQIPWTCCCCQYYLNSGMFYSDVDWTSAMPSRYIKIHVQFSARRKRRAAVFTFLVSTPLTLAK